MIHKLMFRCVLIFCALLLCTAVTAQSNLISFDLGKLHKERQGDVGFLHSVRQDAPVDSFISLLKPKIWRVGRYNDAFALYPRLQSLGVERQILVVSDLRTEKGYRDIFRKYGYGVMMDTILQQTKRMGLDYEFDIFNEPNDSLINDLSGFMHRVWIPAYKAIRAANPKALIHGPSTGINNSIRPAIDSALMFRFLDSAIAYNVVPDFINWHCQVGQSIADWHIEYAKKITDYVTTRGGKFKGILVGETVRPGNERNTSPSVHVDVFAAVEVGEIPQVHTAWSSSKVYGVSTSIPPVICGLLTDSLGKERRGVWWTYRFYAETKGRRLACDQTPTGSATLVGLAFGDSKKKVIRAMVGARDTRGDQPGSKIVVRNLNRMPGLVQQGRVRVKVWYNKQTEGGVAGFGTEQLPLIKDGFVNVKDNSIVLGADIAQWDAVLVEISAH